MAFAVAHLLVVNSSTTPLHRGLQHDTFLPVPTVQQLNNIALLRGMNGVAAATAAAAAEAVEESFANRNTKSTESNASITAHLFCGSARMMGSGTVSNLLAHLLFWSSP
mmetsp:Transcript_32532/g.63684  ORF Transcript_32532/g.63684 Transcript_32532/m.63684 type:complete len:109 (-) Transcript_32532:380-706(-)